MPGTIQQKDCGFTIIELLMVLIIVNIFGAIAAPSLFGLLNRYRVDRAAKTIVGTIKEAQRQSMRQGRLCRVNLNSDNTLTGNPANCLLSDRKIDDDLVIRSNIPGAVPNISFSYRGSTTKMGTIVVSSENTSSQKCFVISLGTGIARTGIYKGSKIGSVSATHCHHN